MSNMSKKTEKIYRYQLREVERITQFTASEVMRFRSVKETLIKLYDHNSLLYEPLIPSGSLLIGIRDIADFKKVYAVLLRNATVDDSEDKDVVIDTIINCTGCTWADDSSEVTDEAFSEFIQNVVKHGQVYMAKYITTLKGERAENVKNGLCMFNISINNEEIIGTSPLDEFIISEAVLFGSNIEEDNVYLSRKFKSDERINECYMTVISLIEAEINNNPYMDFNRVSTSVKAKDKLSSPYGASEGKTPVDMMKYWIDKNGFRRFQKTQDYLKSKESVYFKPTSFGFSPIRDSFGFMLADSGIEGIDIKEILQRFKPSKKEIKSMVVKTWLECAHLTKANANNIETLFGPLFWGRFKSYLLEQANISVIEAKDTDVDRSIEDALRGSIDKLNEQIETIQKSYEDECKKVDAKEKRIAEQEKAIKGLEKEVKDLKEEKEALEEALTAPQVEETQDNDEMDQEQIIDNSLSDEEARDYFLDIIKENAVYIFGAREEFVTKMSKVYPQLKFMGFEKVSAASIDKADMILIRIDGIPHSKYYQLKEKVKLSGIPYRHMNKSEFNEKYLYDAVIDIYEHN